MGSLFGIQVRVLVGSLGWNLQVAFDDGRQYSQQKEEEGWICQVGEQYLEVHCSRIDVAIYDSLGNTVGRWGGGEIVRW
jgi:hypothetical protein